MNEVSFDKYYPIIEFNGDSLICQKSLNSIKSHYGIGDMAISNFNEENFDVLAVINSANQFSFFDEMRLVAIYNIERALTKNEQEAFNNYVKNPNKNAIIAIINSYGFNSFDFVKDRYFVNCKADNAYSFSFIKKEFEKQGKQIGQQEIKMLADYCLNNMTKISLEISKICSYMYDEKIVTANIINKLVTPDEEIKVFELVDALSRKDIKTAQSIIYSLQQQNEPFTKTLGLIAGHFRRLFFSKINKDKSNSMLASELGCKEFAITKAKQQAENFTARELKNIENLILETDYNIKNGKMTAENAMYYLIFSISNKKTD